MGEPTNEVEQLRQQLEALKSRLETLEANLTGASATVARLDDTLRDHAVPFSTVPEAIIAPLRAVAKHKEVNGWIRTIWSNAGAASASTSEAIVRLLNAATLLMKAGERVCAVFLSPRAIALWLVLIGGKPLLALVITSPYHLQVDKWIALATSWPVIALVVLAMLGSDTLREFVLSIEALGEYLKRRPSSTGEAEAPRLKPRRPDAPDVEPEEAQPQDGLNKADPGGAGAGNAGGAVPKTRQGAMSSGGNAGSEP